MTRYDWALRPPGLLKNRKMLIRTTNFVKEAKIELKKVTWPTRVQTIRYTVAVIAMSLAVAAFLGGLDMLFTFLLDTFVL